MTSLDAASTRNVLAWDVPTRLFKWSFALLVVDAWLSNKFGANTPAWHKWNGYAILVAIVFRILWGFVGGSTARFSHFVKPRRVFAYLPSLLKRSGIRCLGHNPPGGLWIIAILAVCAAQGMTGLYSSDHDRVVIEGPLAATVSDAAVERASSWHAAGYQVILWLVTLHLCAVLFYDLAKRQRLVAAMIGGTKPQMAYVDEREATPGSGRAALACLLAAIVLVFGTITLLGGNVMI